MPWWRREPGIYIPTIYGTYLSYSDANMTQVEHGPNIESNDIYHLEVSQKDGVTLSLSMTRIRYTYRPVLPSIMGNT